MPIDIRILGANCNKCDKLEKRISKIVDEYNINAIITKVSEYSELAKYDIYVIPAVLINDNIVSKGIILSEFQIITEINKYISDEDKVIFTKKRKIPSRVFIITILLLIIAFVAYFLKSKPKAVNEHNIVMIDNSNSIINTPDSILSKFRFSDRDNLNKISVLEFGASKCKSCIRMEKVINDIRNEFSSKINIVTYNARTENGDQFADYFNVQAIPTVIILDNKSNEIFRHVGLLSSEELKNEILKYCNEN